MTRNPRFSKDLGHYSTNFLRVSWISGQNSMCWEWQRYGVIIQSISEIFRSEFL